MSRPDVRFGWLVAATFLITLLPRIDVHVPWRDEWQAWMIATDGHPDFLTLIHRCRYEGHPPAWHAMLWALGRLWPDLFVMKLLHAAIATALAFVIAAFAPASRASRTLLCCGYFFAFEYGVVSRNYGLGALPLFAFAALRTWRPNAAIAQACCLALAAQANVYAGMLAGVLALWWGLRWLRSGGRSSRQAFLVAAIIAFGFASAAVELIGPSDRNFGGIASGTSSHRLLLAAGGFWRAACPIPPSERQWWNGNVLDAAFSLPHALRVEAILGAVVAVAMTWLLPARRDVRILWAGGVVMLFVFGVLVYPGELRHQGHALLLFVLAWWLGRSRRQHPRRSDGREAGVTLFFVAQALAGLFASIADVCLPFSASAATARYIENRFPDAALIGNLDHATSPLAALLKRPIEYPRTDRRGTFIIWDARPRIEDVPTRVYTDLADRLTSESPGRPVIAVMSVEPLSTPDFRFFHKRASFTDSTIYSEQYAVYEFDADARRAATLKELPP